MWIYEFETYIKGLQLMWHLIMIQSSCMGDYLNSKPTLGVYNSFGTPMVYKYDMTLKLVS
jgi:hypothetical protein